MTVKCSQSYEYDLTVMSTTLFGPSNKWKCR